MDLNSWIGLTFGIICAFVAHLMGKKSGQLALRKDLKIRLKKIQDDAEKEARTIEHHAEVKLQEVDEKAEEIKSADGDSLIDEFNDAFPGE